MATPAELAFADADLAPDDLLHLKRLLGNWAILADLALSDLVLLAPISRQVSRNAPRGTTLVVLGQIRPSNSATVVESDLVGHVVTVEEWELAVTAYETGQATRGAVELEGDAELVQMQCVPVRHGEHVVGVVARLTAASGRRPGHLERTYYSLFERFAVMLSESTFPFPGEDVATEEAPRVGDGIVVVDDEGRVTYASPNATNALHRMGMFTEIEGRRLTDLGVEESAIEWALASALPVVEEVERRPDVVVLLHCIPLIEHDDVTGCLVLLRDVTDLRRLDRLLLSKDAAIREVHHRVKNNLQTISALLRLQARRLADSEAKVALFEAERRVRSIAVVHEILSKDPGDQVPFDEIVTSLVAMAEDSVVSDQPVTFTVEGELGDVGADVATPLAVVIAELLQNAVEHAFVDGAARSGTGRSITVVLGTSPDTLSVRVEDNGIGIAPDFDLDRSSSLGLSLVRDLIRTQLAGEIRIEPRPGGGTRVEIALPRHEDHRLGV